MKKGIKLTIALSVVAMLIGGFAFVSKHTEANYYAGGTDPGGGRPGG
jgi:hypothetical protein